MPAQKRPHDTPRSEDDNSSIQHNQSLDEQPQEEPTGTYLYGSFYLSDSDGSPSSSIGDKDEFLTVRLAEIRKEVQCPICLGIIRKTRTVMECLHRFCRECIDKSMRLGNNECPACRTHCASRRSLRDDPNYDALIAALYPDIDKYEEEELAFHEEEKARNKQIQTLIAQTMRRQSEALGKKRTSARVTAAAFVRRSQGNYRISRGRRNQRAGEVEGSDDEEDMNGHDEGKDSSSSDEQVTEVKPKRCKRWGGARCSQTYLAAGSANGGGDGNDSEVNRDSVGAAAGLVGSSEMLAWGGGGVRSNTRHGSLSAGNGKNARTIRVSKLLENLRNSVENDGLDINLMLVSLDEERIPSLQLPKICCRPTLSISHLCQYVAMKTCVEADDVEMLLVKEIHSKPDPTASPGVSVSACRTIDPCRDELHILEDHETLAELQATNNFSQAPLLLAYRQKLPGLVDY